MTKAQLVTEIGDRIRTASRNFITEAEILRTLNARIAKLKGTLDLENTITTSTINFTANGSYALPADFRTAISLYDRTNKQLYKLASIDGLYRNETNGYNNYSQVGSNLQIVGNSPASLTLTYYSTNDCSSALNVWQQGLVADTDFPLLQSEYHEFFVEDTASVLFRKEKKWDDYKAAKAEAAEIFVGIAQDNPSRKETIVTTIQPYQEIF